MKELDLEVICTDLIDRKLYGKVGDEHLIKDAAGNIKLWSSTDILVCSPEFSRKIFPKEIKKESIEKPWEVLKSNIRAQAFEFYYGVFNCYMHISQESDADLDDSLLFLYEYLNRSADWEECSLLEIEKTIDSFLTNVRKCFYVYLKKIANDIVFNNK